MAKRKRKSTRRRSRKGLSSAAPRRRRSSARRSKGFLSDMLNPTVAKNSAITAISGGAGGLAAIIAHKFLPVAGAAPKISRIAAALGIGFVLANLGKPNVGAGFTGGMMALSFQNGVLNDGADYASNDSLMDGPIWLDENDQPMTLEEGEEGPQLRYLSDEEINVLHEAGAFEEFEVVG